MRKIKYRAYINRDKYIVGVDTIDFINKEISYEVVEWYMETWSEDANFDDIELMEFTWMKDRKWNLIFEWDICKILFNWWGREEDENDTRTLEEYLWDRAETYIIQFDTNWFYATKNIWWYSECMEHWRHWFIEVIGNIYENPELIK